MICIVDQSSAVSKVMSTFSAVPGLNVAQLPPYQASSSHHHFPSAILQTFDQLDVPSVTQYE